MSNDREDIRMTRINVDARTWSSIRAVCIEYGLEVPELLGAMVKDAVADVRRLGRLARRTVQETNRQ